MSRKLAVALVVAVVLACGALVAQDRRDVVLEIGLPNGEAPQLRITDGGTGTVSIPNLGSFGFVPAIRDDGITVEVFDLNQTPKMRIDQVDITVGAESVQLATSPQFRLRVVRIVTKS
jgi:hypothetical protein